MHYTSYWKDLSQVLAARFTQRLEDLIESGYGLKDSIVESEQAVASRSIQEGRALIRLSRRN